MNLLADARRSVLEFYGRFGVRSLAVTAPALVKLAFATFLSNLYREARAACRVGWRTGSGRPALVPGITGKTRADGYLRS